MSPERGLTEVLHQEVKNGFPMSQFPIRLKSGERIARATPFCFMIGRDGDGVSLNFVYINGHGDLETVNADDIRGLGVVSDDSESEGELLLEFNYLRTGEGEGEVETKRAKITRISHGVDEDLRRLGDDDDFYLLGDPGSGEEAFAFWRVVGLYGDDMTALSMRMKSLETTGVTVDELVGMKLREVASQENSNAIAHVLRGVMSFSDHPLVAIDHLPIHVR